MLVKFIVGCIISFTLGGLFMAYCFNTFRCGYLRIDDSRDVKDIFQVYFTKAPEKVKNMSYILLRVKTGEHLDSQEN